MLNFARQKIVATDGAAPGCYNRQSMTDGEFTYRIEGLSTGYNNGAWRKDLVSAMNAVLRRGELTCMIGVNGAGKSTLLRTMAGLQPMLDGRIELLGRPLQDYSASELSQCVGVVLTDEVPEQNLTAFELVAMGRMPYTGYWGTLSADDHTKVREAIRLVGMENFESRKLSSLSDGERQKLMIAKALAQDTDVILLDEPVAFLDFPSKVAVLRLLSRVAKEYDKSVLLSIHDIELALQIAGRLWVLTGQDFKEGEPHSLAAEGQIDFLFNGQDIRFDRKRLQYSLL